MHLAVSAALEGICKKKRGKDAFTYWRNIGGGYFLAAAAARLQVVKSEKITYDLVLMKITS